jgi:hypothetical protein
VAVVCQKHVPRVRLAAGVVVYQQARVLHVVIVKYAAGAVVCQKHVPRVRLAAGVVVCQKHVPRELRARMARAFLMVLKTI